jgi:hypothetical protein
VVVNVVVVNVVPVVIVVEVVTDVIVVVTVVLVVVVLVKVVVEVLVAVHASNPFLHCLRLMTLYASHDATSKLEFDMILRHGPNPRPHLDTSHQREVSVVVVVLVTVVELTVAVVAVSVVDVEVEQQIDGDASPKRAGHRPVRVLSPTQIVVVEVVYMHGPNVSAPVASAPHPKQRQLASEGGGGEGGGHVCSLNSRTLAE